MPNHVKADFYYRSDSAEVLRALAAQEDDFCTLAKGHHLRVIATDLSVPKGCCLKVISDQLSVLVDLTGLIDVDVEIARLQKDIERVTPMVDQYRRKISAADYASKVPESVQVTNAEKLAAYEAELEASRTALAAFEMMKV